MLSATEIWSLESEWLNAFTENLLRDTRRMLCNIAIEVENDCVVVCGRARSYYAAQLAIHCVQNLNHDRSWFATTRLSLEVGDHSLELRISEMIEKRYESS